MAAPESFKAVLEPLVLAAEQCVFVDDAADYLAPSAELGFATVHAKAPQQTLPQLEDLLGVPLAEEV